MGQEKQTKIAESVPALKLKQLKGGKRNDENNNKGI
jgi:hypothetical protein